jgi:Tfp pilus assembly protein PilF
MSRTARLEPSRLLAAACSALLALGAGCATAPPPAPPAPPGVAELMQRPAERALIEGVRAYEEAQYGPAETQLRKAIATGLRDAKDRASAHKLLAFIACTSDRLVECEIQFRSARHADPGFTLTRSEAGHPLWGPIYRRVVP